MAEISKGIRQKLGPIRIVDVMDLDDREHRRRTRRSRTNTDIIEKTKHTLPQRSHMCGFSPE